MEQRGYTSLRDSGAAAPPVTKAETAAKAEAAEEVEKPPRQQANSRRAIPLEDRAALAR